jgi:hypothetical protein
MMIIREFSSRISHHISFQFSQTKDFFTKGGPSSLSKSVILPILLMSHGILDHILFTLLSTIRYSIHFVFTVSVYPTKETVDFHNPNRDV